MTTYEITTFEHGMCVMLKIRVDGAISEIRLFDTPKLLVEHLLPIMEGMQG